MDFGNRTLPAIMSAQDSTLVVSNVVATAPGMQYLLWARISLFLVDDVFGIPRATLILPVQRRATMSGVRQASVAMQVWLQESGPRVSTAASILTS